MFYTEEKQNNNKSSSEHKLHKNLLLYRTDATWEHILQRR